MNDLVMDGGAIMEMRMNENLSPICQDNISSALVYFDSGI